MNSEDYCSLKQSHPNLCFYGNTTNKNLIKNETWSKPRKEIWKNKPNVSKFSVRTKSEANPESKMESTVFPTSTYTSRLDICYGR